MKSVKGGGDLISILGLAISAHATVITHRSHPIYFSVIKYTFLQTSVTFQIHLSLIKSDFLTKGKWIL